MHSDSNGTFGARCSCEWLLMFVFFGERVLKLSHEHLRQVQDVHCPWLANGAAPRTHDRNMHRRCGPSMLDVPQ